MGFHLATVRKLTRQEIVFYEDLQRRLADHQGRNTAEKFRAMRPFK
jgi:hypothetical protein